MVVDVGNAAIPEMQPTGKLRKCHTFQRQNSQNGNLLKPSCALCPDGTPACAVLLLS